MLFLAAWPALACGEDWPQWGGRDGRNMVAEETALPASFVPGKRRVGQPIDLATTRNVKWIARLGSETYSTPVVAAGRVYIGTNDQETGDPRFPAREGGLLKCFDEPTGKLMWQLVVPATNRHGNRKWLFDNMGLGICAAAAVDGDRVYVVTNRCEVVCLDAKSMASGNHVLPDEAEPSAGAAPVRPGARDGGIRWRFDMVAALPCQPHDAANCSVLVEDELVYVCTSNGVAKGGLTVTYPLAPSLIALDKHTGRLVAADEEKIGTRLFHGQWSSPSAGKVHGRTLIFFGGGDGVCYAFEHLTAPLPDHRVPLRKEWSFDCNPQQYRANAETHAEYWNGDVREHHGNTGDGTYVGPSEIIATPVFSQNRVYVAIGQDPRHGRGRGILHCIDATRSGDVTKSGRIWSYDKLDRSLSTVSVTAGMVFVADVAGVVHCLDAETGECCWTHDTQAEVWGSTLVADGKLYVGTQKKLVVLAADRRKKLLGEIRLGSPVWASPIAANGTLYFASQKYLWAVAKP